MSPTAPQAARAERRMEPDPAATPARRGLPVHAPGRAQRTIFPTTLARPLALDWQHPFIRESRRRRPPVAGPGGG